MLEIVFLDTLLHHHNIEQRKCNLCICAMLLLWLLLTPCSLSTVVTVAGGVVVVHFTLSSNIPVSPKHQTSLLPPPYWKYCMCSQEEESQDYRRIWKRTCCWSFVLLEMQKKSGLKYIKKHSNMLQRLSLHSTAYLPLSLSPRVGSYSEPW